MSKNKLPRFMFVPYLPSNPEAKMVFSPRHLIYWHVKEFDTQQEQAQWLLDNQDFLIKNGALAINLHKKYPYALVCVGVENAIDVDRLVEIGNSASDWYAEHWFKAKNLEKTAKNTPISKYENFYICENHINHKGQEAIIKLSEPQVFIFYKLKDAFFSSFEKFYESIASVQWLNRKPSEEEQETILIDCWNYLRLEEIELEKFNNKNHD